MSYPHTIAIIQARMSSSRLPGKVLRDIGGQPMLVRVVERTRQAETVEKVVVATTTDPTDDAVERLCRKRGYACYRGSQLDVLDRYYQAARHYNADVVVRITADCPLIDPGLIDHMVNSFLGSPEMADLTPPAPDSRSPFPYDLAANRLPAPWGRTYPIGLDIEVCAFQGLEQVWKEAVLPHHREHVMPYFYDHPERFKILHINHDEDFGSMRWTVDTAADLDLVRQIFQHFQDRNDFSWLDILDLVEHEPHLAQINLQVKHKDYREVDSRLDP